MQPMRELVAGADLARAQVSTLRLRLITVGARIQKGVRQMWVPLPSASHWFALWHQFAPAAPG